MLGLIATVGLAASLEQGVALRSQGDLAAAERELLAVVHESPGVDGWVELAVTRSWAGDLGGAIAAYDEALEVDPDSLSAAVGRARVLAWKGRRRGALRELRALPGEDALAEIARVQLARGRRRAARLSIEELGLAGREAEMRELEAQRRELRLTRLTLSGAYVPRGASRAEVSVSRALTGALTVRGGARVGQSLTDPLGSGAWAVDAGLTVAGRRTWVTTGLRWEDGLWGQADVALRLGPCVPGGGATVRVDARAARFQAGLRCELGPMYASARGFLSLTDTRSEALAVTVGTRGKWQVLGRGVVLGRPVGGQGSIGFGFESGPVGIGLEGGLGFGSMKGPTVAATTRFSW